MRRTKDFFVTISKYFTSFELTEDAKKKKIIVRYQGEYRKAKKSSGKHRCACGYNSSSLYIEYEKKKFNVKNSLFPLSTSDILFIYG